MKKIGKVAICTMAAAMACCGFAACGGGLPEGKTVVLDISPFNGGYGIQWLKDMKAAYEDEHPEVLIRISEDVVRREDQLTEIQSGVSDFDIYFTGFNFHGELYKGTKLADISDVYEEIGDKINPAVVNWYEHDGKQYSLPWGTGVLGILYHKDMFAQNNIEVPRTTNELLAVAEKINTVRGNAEKPYAFSYCAKDNYWDYLFNPWFCQYEGIQNYENYWNCIGTNGKQYDQTVVAYDGILRTMEVYEKLMLSTNNYNHPDSKTATFTNMQIHFLDGDTAMMVNGDWTVNELLKSGAYTKEETADIAFMRTPIISSIVEKMDLYTHGTKTFYELTAQEQAAYEAKLTAIIDAVDNGTGKPSDVSQKDYDKIAEARSITPTMACYHNAVIPSASENIEEAKKFLKFMYSDKGLKVYSDSVYACGLPVQYTKEQVAEIAGDSALIQTAYEMLDNAYLTFHTVGKNRVFSQNGLNPTYHNKINWLESFASANASTRKSAKDFYQESCTQIIQLWSNFMKGVK